MRAKEKPIESAQKYPLNKDPSGNSTCSALSRTTLTRGYEVVLGTEMNVLGGNE